MPLPGDLNEDGVVDLLDLMIVSAAYDTSEGDPDFDPRADCNGDGTVNLMDLIFVARHFGDGSSSKMMAMSKLSSLTEVESNTVVRVAASDYTPAAGEEIDVAIEIVDSPGIGGFQFDLLYDPNHLEPITTTEGSFLSGGNGEYQTFNLPLDLQAQGTVGPIVCTRLSRDAASGMGTLFNIRFKVLQDSPNEIEISNLKLVDSMPVEVDAVSEGAVINGTWVDDWKSY